MCYPDGSNGSQPYTSTMCPTIAGAIGQTYDCGRDDYFNPDPAPDSYLATHWNVYTSAFMGSCTQLGMACGDTIVPSPPVNTATPTVSGQLKPGYALTATAGTWLNNPTSYLIQWQRAVGGDWATIPGASGPTTCTRRRRGRGPARGGRRDQRRRLGDRGLGADGPRRRARPVPTSKPKRRELRIALRDRARHAKGTLAARVVAVPAGREVRTDARKVAVTPGTWRLRLCAGPKKGSLRCALSKRVRTRTRSVRLPAAKVLVRSAKGALTVTAGAGRQALARSARRARPRAPSDRPGRAARASRAPRRRSAAGSRRARRREGRRRGARAGR
jgi:hypothetical protein